MGYSIISLAQGAFFQKTVLLVYAVFSIFRATSSQNSSRLVAKSIVGGAFFGHLSLESFPWWGSDARSAGEGI